jgi:hypothetical protein
MKVGIGYCNKQDAFDSGKTAARAAIRGGSISGPDLAVAFCAGCLDHENFFHGVKDIVGNTPVIGGSSIGIITNESLSYKGFPSGVALLQLDKKNIRSPRPGISTEMKRPQGQIW